MLRADALSDPIRLLFVEDDEDYRAVLRSMVQRLGVEQSLEALFLTRVADARKALDSSRIDVVLSDFHLPDGTGAEVLAHARTAAPAAHRIVLTAHPESADAATGGADAVWEKSFNIHDLRRNLEGMVASQLMQRLSRPA